jgi:hypothetical protein
MHGGYNAEAGARNQVDLAVIRTASPLVSTCEVKWKYTTQERAQLVDLLQHGPHRREKRIALLFAGFGGTLDARYTKDPRAAWLPYKTSNLRKKDAELAGFPGHTFVAKESMFEATRHMQATTNGDSGAGVVLPIDTLDRGLLEPPCWDVKNLRDSQLRGMVSGLFTACAGQADHELTSEEKAEQGKARLQSRFENLTLVRNDVQQMMRAWGPGSEVASAGGSAASSPGASAAAFAEATSETCKVALFSIHNWGYPGGGYAGGMNLVTHEENTEWVKGAIGVLESVLQTRRLAWQR